LVLVPGGLGIRAMSRGEPSEPFEVRAAQTLLETLSR
jgi:hypothetical protein